MSAMLAAPVLTAGLLLLTSCADWPDELDPNDWYSAASGEDAAPSGEPVPGADGEYPELSEVPQVPQNVSTPEEIDQVAASLAADFANAQYTRDIVRADDETAPSAVPVPTSVASAETEELTIITAGDEIAIAAAEPVEVVEVTEAMSLQAPEPLSAPPSEVDLALADGIAGDTLMVVPAAAPAADVVMASQVETEVLRDQDGELVGSVTRVVGTSVVVADAGDAELMVSGAEVSGAEIDEPMVVAVAESNDLMLEDGGQVLVIAESLTVPSSSVADDGSQSLVALSERDVTDNIVVMPDYIAAADISTSQPAVAPEVMVEPQTTEEMAVMAGTQQDVFIDAEGNLVGAITTTNKSTTTTVAAAETVSTVSAAGVDDTLMVTTVPAVAAEPIEPGVVVATSSVTTPSVTVTEVPAISYEDLSFDELFNASGPTSTTQSQNVASVGSPTTVINDATFTSAGNGLFAETLAAIIRFGHGSSALGADERQIIAQLAAIHRQTGGPIRLVGHASHSGAGLADADRALVNFKVSLDRATAVANELIRNGVPRGDVLIEAAAATDSMAAAAGVQSEAVDRRVEVFFGV
ncbi:MAG: OmpA family protein [Alphaproteobacteria bacterium]|nr:OmpA family protein [Alphaproteobacteria bacterium]